MPYLHDGSHWQLNPVKDVKVFFANLGHLVPNGATLCLAEADWSEEGREFVRSHGHRPEETPLPSEFRGEPCFELSPGVLRLLSDLASRHASPELAIHLGVFASGEALVEWFDLPGDPISVSPSMPEERVEGFATACGVEFQWRPG